MSLHNHSKRSATLPRNSRFHKATRPLAASPALRQNVKPLPPRSRRLSSQWRSLLFLQKLSSGIAFCLVASVLGVYAWSVYTPRIWGQEYKKLETLQRHERHLTAMNETIKNQLAQQAEKPETGLANLHPGQIVFLSPTPVPSRSQPQKATAKYKPIIGKTPVAY
ncbi:MAG: hypothetical protein IGR93_04725 [Hydrococcus sp. C42_A2020_068]|nr:hypothetical protein [Hydrococcus sp. C42_A2020_068]